ncbi:GNAT family N-acetyltransferase [Spongiimicrobium sp. 3-5]|uniref:GNAT family N-acetyltransferase n=1 Tax=Spongiimicrobium sp. 3-5 TaxID=3332596 RepID=UPI00397F9FB8
MKDVKIISFEPKYAKDFAQLNTEWLEKYFVVEPHDTELMEACEENIIDKGGFIFFAQVGESIAGTFSLIKLDNGFYELGKMAVSPSFQGHKIGQKLMQFCIDYARTNGWERLVLYSNTILENAIYIYRKYGFKEVPLEENPPYLRGNIKMELIL